VDVIFPESLLLHEMLETFSGSREDDFIMNHPTCNYVNLCDKYQSKIAGYYQNSPYIVRPVIMPPSLTITCRLWLIKQFY